jgi:transcription initiation factor TFIID TATA-box-binding protein
MKETDSRTSDSSFGTLSPDLSIVNLVGTFELGVELDLLELSKDLEAKYEPEVYPSMVYKAQNELSILVPTSGNIVLVGVETPAELKQGLNEFLEKLSELGIELDVDSSNIEIQNIVANGNLNKEIDLTALSIGLGLEDTEYEPEQFPGVIYRSNSSVILIFGSGKFVITGADNIYSVNSAYNNIREELTELGLIN